jgi:hypothetical protein
MLLIMKFLILLMRGNLLFAKSAKLPSLWININNIISNITEENLVMHSFCDYIYIYIYIYMPFTSTLPMKAVMGINMKFYNRLVNIGKKNVVSIIK